MRITNINVYGVELPYKEGPYRCRNHTEYSQTATIVEIRTDEGVTGFGEITPLGSFYSEAFTDGIRAGICLLAPSLLGANPRETRKVMRLMDSLMYGQMDVKSPIDMALWDIHAQASGLPLAECLGGRDGDGVKLYRGVSQDTPESMAASTRRYLDVGYRHMQVKVGTTPTDDALLLRRIVDITGPDIPIYCDANGAWTSQEALQFIERTRDVHYTFEQPCATLEENLRVRRSSHVPMVLDESCDSLAALLRIHETGAADGITIKISRFGGITRARQVRDLAVDMGLQITVECIGGSEIATSAIAHMSLSTPERQRTHTVDFHNWKAVSTATGMPAVSDGLMYTPDSPGLGVQPMMDVLGSPLHTFAA